MSYTWPVCLMVKAALRIKNIGIVNEKIDQKNIFAGEYKWKS